MFDILQNFDPVENSVDRRIIYEISGTKITDDKYWDSSDKEVEDKIDDDNDVGIEAEEDPNWHLRRPMTGYKKTKGNRYK